MAKDLEKKNSIATYGPYETIHELGRGSMGVVFLARRTPDAEPVALKVLPEVFTHDPGYATHFLHHARMVSALKDPGIVPVLDFGQDGPLLYVASQFIDCSSALGISREHPYGMNWPGACRIIHDVTAGLAYAAQQGVLHRDIKPANILVANGSDHVLINNLALAKVHMLDAAEITGHLCTVGTPSYFSPELIRNEKTLDHRSDIYSLGAVLYRLVCGQPPFRRETALAVIAAHLTEPVPDPHKLHPGLPPGVGELILRMLAKDPADRPQTYDALREVLEQVMDGQEPGEAAMGGAALATIETSDTDTVLEQLRFMDHMSFEREDEPWYIFTDAPLTWEDFEGTGEADPAPAEVSKSEAGYKFFELATDVEFELEDVSDRELPADATASGTQEMKVATAGGPSALELEPRTFGPESEQEIEPDPGLELEPDPGLELEPDPGLELEPDPGLELEPDPGLELDLESDPESEPEVLIEDGPSTFMNLPVPERRRPCVDWIMDNAIPLVIIWSTIILALAAYVLIAFATRNMK